MSAAYAVLGSSSGAIRMETFAEALGTSVLEAFSTVGALMPIVVIDGLVQSRSRMGPLPINSTPSNRPDSRRNRSSS